MPVADLLFLGIVVTFFVLASLFVKACDRIVRHDDLPDRTPSEPEPLEVAR